MRLIIVLVVGGGGCFQQFSRALCFTELYICVQATDSVCLSVCYAVTKKTSTQNANQCVALYKPIADNSDKFGI